MGATGVDVRGTTAGTQVLERPCGDGESVAATAAATVAAPRRRPVLRAVRTHFGTVAGAVILGVLLWRLGTGVFLDGVRRVDGPVLLAGLGIGLLTTVLSAWRWAEVARGLGRPPPPRAAPARHPPARFLPPPPPRR
ncbi:hypothetical protein OK074_2931, partial [Actinobacteria bacterium OK074]